MDNFGVLGSVHHLKGFGASVPNIICTPKVTKLYVFPLVLVVVKQRNAQGVQKTVKMLLGMEAPIQAINTVFFFYF